MCPAWSLVFGHTISTTVRGHRSYAPRCPSRRRPEGWSQAHGEAAAGQLGRRQGSSGIPAAARSRPCRLPGTGRAAPHGLPPARKPEGHRLLVGELPSHPVPDPFGHGEFVAIGPHLIELHDELFFECAQLRVSRGDPFRDLGLHHAAERRRHEAHDAEKPAKPHRSALSDDQDGRLPPTIITSTSTERQTRASDQHVRRWRRLKKALRQQWAKHPSAVGQTPQVANTSSAVASSVGKAVCLSNNPRL